jgi:hypothetical protein
VEKGLSAPPPTSSFHTYMYLILSSSRLTVPVHLGI